MDIKEQKRIAHKVLTKLSLLHPTMLAGGSVSDWSVGKEANDLDFFVSIEHSNSLYTKADCDIYMKEVINVLTGINFKKLSKPSKGSNDYTELLCYIKGIYEAEFEGIKIQVMLCVQDLPSILSLFDANVVKAFVDITKIKNKTSIEELSLDKACISAHKHKIVIIQHVGGKEPSEARVSKLKRKYSGYIIISGNEIIYAPRQGEYNVSH